MQRPRAARQEAGEERQTLAEITTERIRSDIIAGRLQSGGRLMMNALCKRYGVSMSPLREALSGLAAEQFVTFERHRGFRVGVVSLADLNDLTETRKIIETDVVRLALRHGDEVWESHVIAAFHQLSHMEQRILQSGHRDDKAWELRNAQFHEAIVAACPLNWLKQLRAQMFMKAQRYRYLAWSALPDAASVAAEHIEIFEATMARDEERLVAATHVHIENVAVFARELVRAGSEV
jgi:GntR family transcriptional regulator, carbon starvation induced regulator